MGQFLGVIYNEFNYLHHLTHYYLLRYHDRLVERNRNSSTPLQYSKDEYVRFENKFFVQIFEEFFKDKGHFLKYDHIRHHSLKEEVLYTVVHYPHELLPHMGHSKRFKQFPSTHSSEQSLELTQTHTQTKDFNRVRPYLVDHRAGHQTEVSA